MKEPEGIRKMHPEDIHTIFHELTVKQTELEKREKHYRSLFENNPIETIIVDHEARITEFNIAKSRLAD